MAAEAVKLAEELERSRQELINTKQHMTELEREKRELLKQAANDQRIFDEQQRTVELPASAPMTALPGTLLPVAETIPSVDPSLLEQQQEEIRRLRDMLDETLEHRNQLELQLNKSRQETPDQRGQRFQDSPFDSTLTLADELSFFSATPEPTPSKRELELAEAARQAQAELEARTRELERLLQQQDEERCRREKRAQEEMERLACEMADMQTAKELARVELDRRAMEDAERVAREEEEAERRAREEHDRRLAEQLWQEDHTGSQVPVTVPPGHDDEPPPANTKVALCLRDMFPTLDQSVIDAVLKLHNEDFDKSLADLLARVERSGRSSGPQCPPDYTLPSDQLPPYPDQDKKTPAVPATTAAGTALSRRSSMSEMRERLIRDKRDREAQDRKDGMSRQALQTARPQLQPGMIKFICPYCQGQMQARPGDQVKCPHCQRHVNVPEGFRSESRATPPVRRPSAARSDPNSDFNIVLPSQQKSFTVFLCSLLFDLAFTVKFIISLSFFLSAPPPPAFPLHVSMRFVRTGQNSRFG